MTDGPSLAEQWEGTPHAKYEIDGKTYEVKTEPRCRVCRSGYREIIEDAIFAGYTRKTILDVLPDGVDITYRNIQDHYRNGHAGHMQATKVSWLHRKAEERGQDLLEQASNVIDGRILAEAVMIRTWELIADGTLIPSVGDGLNAAKFIQVEEATHTGGSDLEMIYEAFTYYHSVVQTIMTDDQKAEYARRITNNPFLTSLAQRAGFVGEEDLDDGLLDADAFDNYEHPKELIAGREAEEVMS